MNKQPEESKIKLLTKPVVSSRLPDAFYYNKKPTKHKQNPPAQSNELSQARKKLNKIAELTSGEHMKLTLSLEPRYEDFVTITSISPVPPFTSSRKVLSARSLQMYMMESLPLTRELKEQLKEWKAAQSKVSRLCKLVDVF